MAAAAMRFEATAKVSPEVLAQVLLLCVCSVCVLTWFRDWRVIGWLVVAGGGVDVASGVGVGGCVGVIGAVIGIDVGGAGGVGGVGCWCCWCCCCCRC